MAAMSSGGVAPNQTWRFPKSDWVCHTAEARQLTGYYDRRWGMQRRLRDTKDLRFGMGIGAVRVQSPKRRGVHSLFRQGCVLYDLILTMPDAELRPLM